MCKSAPHEFLESVWPEEGVRTPGAGGAGVEPSWGC